MTEYSDCRTSGQRRKDAGIVARQIAKISDSEASRAYQNRIFDIIMKGRQLRDFEPYRIERLQRPTDFLVAVSGEVLVRTENRERAAQTLQPAGFGTGVGVAELDNRVTRFANPAASAQVADDLARLLQDRHIPASVNYIVPLGYVAKGEGGFEPTSLAPDYDGPGPARATGVQVAVVDTGIASEERADGWLQNIPRTPQNTDPLYVPGQGDLLDFSAGHGTFVTGVIQQIAPSADIRMYHAIDSDGIGNELQIATAILQAARDGAQLINLSLGTETERNAPPVGLGVALEILGERHPDVLLVAAAGNSGHTDPMWPAAFCEVVAVASLTEQGTPSTWSNHGPWVDCSTIGEGVVSTYVPGQESEEVDKDQPDLFESSSWAIGTGTSFATPQIVGSLADLMDGSEGLTAREALGRLLSPEFGAQPIPDYGMGVKVLPGTPS